jgi:hypothetical protein
MGRCGVTERGSGFHAITDQMIAKAASIEREKHGRALTDDEAKTLRAVDFLRKIAPYAFASNTEEPTV